MGWTPIHRRCRVTEEPLLAASQTQIPHWLLPSTDSGKTLSRGPRRLRTVLLARRIASWKGMGTEDGVSWLLTVWYKFHFPS